MLFLWWDGSGSGYHMSFIVLLFSVVLCFPRSSYDIIILALLDLLYLHSLDGSTILPQQLVSVLRCEQTVTICHQTRAIMEFGVTSYQRITCKRIYMSRSLLH